ncbi:MAG: hypothetical protein II336_16840 [Loktanella sp.]|nr:hypothetical protein [Loktanella sp.]
MDKKTFAPATRAPALLTLVSAGFFVFAAGFAAQADEAPQSWVPDVLVMPEDIEVLTDREIGSSLRMFSFSTAVDVDELLADWEAKLREAGYTIVLAEVETLDRVIEFSGPDINNAKIAVTPSTMDDLHVVEFDATLP